MSLKELGMLEIGHQRVEPLEFLPFSAEEGEEGE
jgi:hypothetical protein